VVLHQSDWSILIRLWSDVIFMGNWHLQDVVDILWSAHWDKFQLKNVSKVNSRVKLLLVPWMNLMWNIVLQLPSCLLILLWNCVASYFKIMSHLPRIKHYWLEAGKFLQWNPLQNVAHDGSWRNLWECSSTEYSHQSPAVYDVGHECCRLLLRFQGSIVLIGWPNYFFLS
jgi:hypothetical protein